MHDWIVLMPGWPGVIGSSTSPTSFFSNHVMIGATFILSIVAPASIQAQACAREVTIERCIPIEYLLVSSCAARIPSSVAGS